MRRLRITSPPLWRENPIFRHYETAQAVSAFGGWLQIPAIAWLAYQATARPSTALALAMLVGLLPSTFISPLGGRIADRYPTRTVMLVSQIALALQAGALGIVQVIGNTQVWSLYLLQALASCANGLDIPAEGKLLPQLVGKRHLQDALAINSAFQNLAWIAGPPLAGVIIGTWGTGGITCLFLFNTVSYGGVVVYLLRLPIGRDVPLPETGYGDTAFAYKGTLWETIKYILNTPKLWLLVLVSAIMALNSCGGVLQPLIGLQLGGIHGYTFISMSNGIGCLAGSFCSLLLKKQTIQRQIVLAAVSSAFLAGFGISPTLGLAMLMMAAGTMVAQVWRNGTGTLIQLYVPLHQLGRVNGVQQCIRTAGIIISSLSAGFVLVPAIGASYTGAGLSAAALVCFAPIWVVFLRLRRAGKLEEISNT